MCRPLIAAQATWLSILAFGLAAPPPPMQLTEQDPQRLQTAGRAAGRSLRFLILSVRKPGVEENAAAVDDLSQSILPTLDIPQVREE